MPYQNFPYSDFQNLNLDWILQKLLQLLNDEHGTGAVESVNGKTGVVVLTASDVGAYVKPSGGIPLMDLAQTVRTSLAKADVSYVKPSGGIPKSDLTAAVQASLNKADTAYQKPSSGIPTTDLAAAVLNLLLPVYGSEDAGRFLRVGSGGVVDWDDYDTTIKTYINNQIADAISGVDTLIGTGVIT